MSPTDSDDSSANKEDLGPGKQLIKRPYNRVAEFAKNNRGKIFVGGIIAAVLGIKKYWPNNDSERPDSDKTTTGTQESGDASADAENGSSPAAPDGSEQRTISCHVETDSADAAKDSLQTESQSAQERNHSAQAINSAPEGETASPEAGDPSTNAVNDSPQAMSDPAQAGTASSHDPTDYETISHLLNLSRRQKLRVFCEQTWKAMMRHHTFALAGALAFSTVLSAVPFLWVGRAICAHITTENSLNDRNVVSGPAQGGAPTQAVGNPQPSPTKDGITPKRTTNDRAMPGESPREQGDVMADGTPRASQSGQNASFSEYFLKAVDATIPKINEFKPLCEYLAGLDKRPAKADIRAWIPLLLGVFSFLFSLDGCINRLWEAPAPSLCKRIEHYVIIIIIIAIVMAFSGFIYSSCSGWQINGFLWLLTVFTLTLLILVTPNINVPTKSRLRSAIVGGMVGGSLIQGIRYGFGAYVDYVAPKLTEFYGNQSLVIPLTLIWLWLTWLLVIFGAEIAFLVQHFNNLAIRAHLEEEPEVFHKYRIYIAVMLLLRVYRDSCRSDVTGDAQIQATADELKVPNVWVEQVADDLYKSGLVQIGERGRYTHIHQSNELSVQEIVDRLQPDKLLIWPCENRASFPKSLDDLFDKSTRSLKSSLATLNCEQLYSETNKSD